MKKYYYISHYLLVILLGCYCVQYASVHKKGHHNFRKAVYCAEGLNGIENPTDKSRVLVFNDVAPRQHGFKSIYKAHSKTKYTCSDRKIDLIPPSFSAETQRFGKGSFGDHYTFLPDFKVSHAHGLRGPPFSRM